MVKAGPASPRGSDLPGQSHIWYIYFRTHIEWGCRASWFYTHIWYKMWLLFDPNFERFYTHISVQNVGCFSGRGERARAQKSHEREDTSPSENRVVEGLVTWDSRSRQAGNRAAFSPSKSKNRGKPHPVPNAVRQNAVSLHAPKTPVHGSGGVREPLGQRLNCPRIRIRLGCR